MERRDELKKIKIYLKKLPVVLAMTAIIFGWRGISVQAASDFMPDVDATKQGTLSICMSYTDKDDKVIYIDGAELEIYQVASLKVQGGSAVYTALSVGQTEEVDFEGLTVAESLELAKKFSGWIKNAGITGASKITGEDGKAVFEGLQHGMYLVVQKSSKQTAAKYEKISPFLIAVPFPQISEEGNSWDYDVEAEPKTEIIKKKPSNPGSSHHKDESSGEPKPEPGQTTGVSSVKTGDNAPIGWLLLLAAVCSAGVVCVIRSIKRRK